MHTPIPPPAPQAPAPAATLRFRASQFRAYAGTQGLSTDTELAAATGLDRSTVNRLLRADVTPGHRIIAAILATWPDRRFEDFFEVTTPGTAAAQAA